jgi:hypothetical protein
VQIDQAAHIASASQYQQSLMGNVAIAIPGVLSRAVDEYVGPGGVGYQVRLEYRHDGKLWRRVITYGPEAWRSHGWEEIPEII